jgi:hypothetical protein
MASGEEDMFTLTVISEQAEYLCGKVSKLNNVKLQAPGKMPLYL